VSHFLYAGTSGNAGGSKPSSSSFNGKTVPFNFSFVWTNQRGRGPRRKNFEDFQKGLDAIWRFAAKGVRPMMCARVHAT